MGVVRRYVPLLLLVAAIWGASYMFIKVAVDEIEPVPMMALRLLLRRARARAVPDAAPRRRARAIDDLKAAGWGLVLLGLINTPLPFTLIAWGEKHVDSSSPRSRTRPCPIFIALLAIKFRQSERVTGLRLVGILLGFLGVGVLVGFHPEGGWWAVAGTLAIVLASLFYAISNLFAQARYGRRRRW